jgi:hypothetical protein
MHLSRVSAHDQSITRVSKIELESWSVAGKRTEFVLQLSLLQYSEQLLPDRASSVDKHSITSVAASS